MNIATAIVTAIIGERIDRYIGAPPWLAFVATERDATANTHTANHAARN